ncbi:PucR family transcriptional regulator [Nocardia sp. NBC_00565]|uniref:PucR family transcriptional regulator n=1 Tax=Nocardia sp. NBC_00565 TaxID=2975993 RepID=UPI002E80EA7E|nr:PucR family transcriptional regulator [Nocardia sp. NBC_00565]WUC07554.1 PucR family transcriptional regulator [Nocardia sp. NBC_00565]
MAISLRDLTRQTDLRLRTLTDADSALDHPISWVHPSELLDPTPYLDGGELLLTTGLAVDDGNAADYVRRLADARVAGIGFGTGLNHLRVPPTLLHAASAAGVPVLEIPEAIPFIAITKAVSRAMAAQEYAGVVRAQQGQRALTAAAVRRDGTGAVVRALAGLVNGWVLLANATGEIREVFPAVARGLSAELTAHLGLPRTGTWQGELAGRDVVIHALGTRTASFLAVATVTPLDPVGHLLVQAAASLLSLAVRQHAQSRTTLRRLRTTLFPLLIAQADGAADLVETTFGPLPDPPWSVCMLVGGESTVDAVETICDTARQRTFFAEYGPGIAVLASGEVPMTLLDLARVVGPYAGLSIPVSPTDIGAGVRQATWAADTARRTRVPAVRFADLAGAGLLALVDADTRVAFAEAVLGPLREHDRTHRGDLVTALRYWLECNGHWDRAAARMGVHRHTMRTRIDKVAELTGRDMDAPGVRAELWLALSVGSLRPVPRNI